MATIDQLQLMRIYFNSGETQEYSFRKRQLEAFKAALLKYEDALYEALYFDLKKTKEECWVTEHGLLMQEINYALKNLKSWMQPKRVKTSLLNLPSSSYLYPSAKGVTLIIGAWNFPLQLLLIPVVGAIAAGNCAVIKPSEFAPATATVIEKMISETFSEKFALVVQGSGASVVPNMMNSFRFDHIFYTGSIPVGKAIYQMAAKDLIPITLELGGKAPCIVENDADLAVAAKRIAVGKFTNAGQMCVCPDYVLVHEAVKDKLMELIKEATTKFYSDKPESEYGYGKIINKQRFDKLVSYLSQGSIAMGGYYDENKLFIAPTLLDKVSLDAPVMQEEIFGPILPVVSYKTTSEAVDVINRNPNPLSFYVFTSNKKKEEEWLQQIQFGTACVNNTAWQFTNHHLPFGGIGQSGIGSYHGRQTYDVFTHYKAVMKTPTWFDPSVKYPPLKGKLKLLKWVVR
ncbi:MAG TPA: aldehyde dehydrogenase family protein [Chitinophagaceae bacterium]|nr:aldehyde dehydrogenase family protein [Chitinophagaceae bacterium]